MSLQTRLRARRISAFVWSTAALAISPAVQAQEADAVESGVRDIIVTAQKREQSLQDVPIAVTALTEDALRTSRIQALTDLGSTTPNLAMTPQPGGSNTPAISMRGVLSTSGQAGQDRSISQYLDGVYISSIYGFSSEFPDLERIEVLRGPQGTLFGRNATGGAISIITRDPSGELGLRQAITVGNRDQLRVSTRVELPSWGPLSGSISYTHDERRGDIRNTGAGTVWDRTGTGSGQGIAVSPKWLGSRNSEIVFGALKFEPSDRFRMVYKFDWSQTWFTPEGSGAAVFSPERVPIPETAAFVLALASQPRTITGVTRPKELNNFFTTWSKQTAYGHNLTAYFDISDNLALKNIFGWRKSRHFANSTTSSLDGILVTPEVATLLGRPQSLVGSPFVLNGNNVASGTKQWSDELQINYTSSFLDVTAGVLYYQSDAYSGGPSGLINTYFLTIIPNFKLPVDGLNFTNAKTKSYAGYAQAEVHITPQLDIVGGLRLTKDVKNGTGYVRNVAFPFHFSDTRPTYLIGANFKPTDGFLVYGKYSTAFVAGGASADIQYPPETVKSWEAGLKADLFDRRVRFNLAVFKADYKNLQGVSSGRNQVPPRPELGTLIVREGDLKTKGFEVETTLIPVNGVTLSGGLGYVDVKLFNQNPIIGIDRRAAIRPKWTANVSAQYDSDPIFSDATLMFRVDGNWRSVLPSLYRTAILPPSYDEVKNLPARWLVNSRLALRNIELSGGKVEVAVWVKNLFDYDKAEFAFDANVFGAVSWGQARSFGLDATLEF